MQVSLATGGRCLTAFCIVLAWSVASVRGAPYPDDQLLYVIHSFGWRELVATLCAAWGLWLAHRRRNADEALPWFALVHVLVVWDFVRGIYEIFWIIGTNEDAGLLAYFWESSGIFRGDALILSFVPVTAWAVFFAWLGWPRFKLNRVNGMLLGLMLITLLNCFLLYWLSSALCEYEVMKIEKRMQTEALPI